MDHESDTDAVRRLLREETARMEHDHRALMRRAYPLVVLIVFLLVLAWRLDLR